MTALVIGYGNALRRDDAAGLHVARAVAARGTGVAVMECAQLVPELAEPIAGAGRVVFVDAVLGRAVESRLLGPIAPALLSHVTDPRALLVLAAQVFGRRPPAWIVTVPAFDTGIGEGLSPETAAVLDGAIAAVLDLIG
jgi:hydrogenase maturation protease